MSPENNFIVKFSPFDSQQFFFEMSTMSTKTPKNKKSELQTENDFILSKFG